MKLLFFTLCISTLIACNNTEITSQETDEAKTEKADDSLTTTDTVSIDENLADEDATISMDTVYIGENRAIKSLQQYFSSEPKVKENVCVIIDEGTYYTKSLWIDGKNVIIKGKDRVNIYCTSFIENVLWVTGENITIENLHMKHFAPGSINFQNCSGRVIAFDNATNIIIDGCDLNGCGLAGLHDNGGNSNILIKNNYIHNNSVGAYTDMSDVWQDAIPDHPVFRFENNRIKNNGEDRKAEPNDIKDYITVCPPEVKNEVIELIRNTYEEWKDAESELTLMYMGTEIDGEFKFNFEDSEGKTIDFGMGKNDLGGIKLYDTKSYIANPESIGKQFKIQWEWKLSTIKCCSGKNKTVKAFMPSIIKLEEG